MLVGLATFVMMPGCGSKEENESDSGSSKYQPADDSEIEQQASSDSDSGSSSSSGTGGGVGLAGGNTSGTPGSGVGSPSNPGGGTGLTNSGGSNTNTGPPPTQPPSLSSNALEQSTYEVPANAGKNELLAFLNRMNQMMGQQVPQEDAIKIQQARVKAAELLFTPEADELTRVTSIRVKADALQRLYVYGEESAREQLVEYSGVLVRDPSRTVAALGNLYQLGLVTQAYLSEKEDVPYEQMREKFVQVVNQFSDQPEIYVMSQQMLNALAQLDKKEEAKDLLQIASDAYLRSPNPEIAMAGAQMRDQLALMQVNYEELRIDTFNKKEGAMQALVEASYQLIGSDKPSPLLFSEVLQTARLLEMTHNFAQAKQVFDLLELAGQDHPNAELVHVAELSVRSARKRISMLGQPVALSGTTLSDTELDWAAYQGKYTLVIVWSTRWSDSLIHFPDYDRVLDEYADKGLMVVGINVDEDVTQAKAFKNQLNLRWPSIAATVDDQVGIDSPLSKQLGADAPPYTFLVDPNGNIVKLHLYADDMFATLDEIFGVVREPAPEQGTQPDQTGQQNATGGDGQ